MSNLGFLPASIDIRAASLEQSGAIVILGKLCTQGMYNPVETSTHTLGLVFLTSSLFGVPCGCDMFPVSMKLQVTKNRQKSWQ